MSDIKHGTVNGYMNRKCRCGACRKAWADYHGRYRTQRHARGICCDCPAPVCTRSTWRCWPCLLIHAARNTVRRQRRSFKVEGLLKDRA